MANELNIKNGIITTTISASTYQNISDSVIGKFLSLSGGTVTGNTVFTSGLTITGDTIITDYTGTATALDTSTRELVDTASSVSLDWRDRLLKDSVGVYSTDWANRWLIDNAGTTSVDWQGGVLYNLNTGTPNLDWTNRLLYDSSNTNTIDWESGVLYNSAGLSIDWVNKQMKDNGPNLSIDWSNRLLTDGSELTVFDWQNKIMTGMTNIQSSTISATSLNLSGSQIDSAWTSYVPVWTAASVNPVLNNGTITGSYKLIGKTCFVRLRLQMGSTTTYGTGAWYFSLPFNAVSAYDIIMPATMLNNGTAWYSGTVNGGRLGNSSKTEIQWQNTGGTADGISPTVPFVWGDTDELEFNGSYEIA